MRLGISGQDSSAWGMSSILEQVWKWQEAVGGGGGGLSCAGLGWAFLLKRP